MTGNSHDHCLIISVHQSQQGHTSPRLAPIICAQNNRNRRYSALKHHALFGASLFISTADLVGSSHTSENFNLWWMWP
uniref:Uncharacterized protein n=1 Tax=Aegilops tauschii subsp. strangulata TaxID=200361 RepID=A0A452YXV1_AEGTS